MRNELFNILSDNNNIEKQKLIDYLNDKLSDKEKNEVEQWMTANDFANDAVEGLHQLKNKKSLQSYVDQLNRQLKIQLEQKRQRKQKRKIKEHPWIYIAAALILVLCVVAYFV